MRLKCSACDEELDKGTWKRCIGYKIYCINNGAEHLMAGEVDDAEVVEEKED